MPKLRLAFLLSGRGSTLANLLRAIEAKGINAEVVKVISSLSLAGGLEIAAKAGIPTAVVRKKDHKDTESFSAAITRELDMASPDYVILGGFMCLYLFPEHYRNKVLNVHPALLPAFGGKGMYGENVHRAVLECGAKISGCTVHFVNEEYDSGPIIGQLAVAVKEDDDTHSLAIRVQRAERRLLPEVVQLLSEGRVQVHGRKVSILPAPLG